LTNKAETISSVKKTAIFTDSLSVLQSIQSGHSKNQPAMCNNILKKASLIRSLEYELILVWVSSNVGITGNERADKCAKQASLNGDTCDSRSL
jgi:ribonuclease HI